MSATPIWDATVRAWNADRVDALFADLRAYVGLDNPLCLDADQRCPSCLTLLRAGKLRRGRAMPHLPRGGVMGTNYYAEQPPCPNPCAHCEQPQFHIGKNLCMFAAHAVTPWGRIASWQDWKRVLSLPGVVVLDEYGLTHLPARFIEDVEKVPMKARRRQYDWMVLHGHVKADDPNPRDWLDADGFSFTDGEFS